MCRIESWRGCAPRLRIGKRSVPGTASSSRYSRM
jgi:hypothetical protein